MMVRDALSISNMISNFFTGIDKIPDAFQTFVLL